jgi:ArsR family transcriptional regulator
MKHEKAAKQLEALGSPTRLQVYRTLVRAGDTGLPVGRLQGKPGSPPQRYRTTCTG